MSSKKKNGKNGVRRRRKAMTAKTLKNEFAKELDLEQPLVKRAAALLNFAAEKYPHQYVPWNWVLQAIMGYGRTPKIDNREVEAIRARGSSIRQVMINLYNRTTDQHPGLGVRALVDDADVLRYAMPKVARRFESARASMITHSSLVNLRKVPKTPALKPFVDWYQTDVKQIVKLVGTNSFQKRLKAPTEDK